MIKFFISHKKEDEINVKRLRLALERLGIPYYLDLIDDKVSENGRELTEHIKANLNDCTDIIVIMSKKTLTSQWVPFEVGMAAQKEMPTATLLEEDVKMPEFLEYWPRLKSPDDIKKYVQVRTSSWTNYGIAKDLGYKKSKVQYFYDEVKKVL